MFLNVMKIHNNSDTTCDTTILKIGVLKKIFVNVLSLEDGKCQIVNLTKKIIDNLVEKKLKVSDVSENLVNQEFSKINQFPDPDLAIISGKISSTYGFLPWHIKVTEFE